MNAKHIYVTFLGFGVLAAASLIHVSIIYVPVPFSTHGSLAHYYHRLSTGALLLTSVLGAANLFFKRTSTVLAATIWLIMITGLYCCIIVLIRSTLWLRSSNLEKEYNMENQTIRLFQRGDGIEGIFTQVMQEKHCCGIKNILDLYQLRALSFAESGDISTLPMVAWYIPDQCCTEPKPKCGYDAYGDIKDAYFTVTSRQLSDTDEFEEVVNGSLKGKMAVFQIPQPLEVMLGETADELENIAYVSNPNITSNTAACSLPLATQKNTALYIYYFGLVKLNQEGNYVACDHTDLCAEKDYILYKFPVIEEFCSLLNDTHDLNNLGEDLQINLLKRSEHFYTEGCGEYLMKYTDSFSIVGLCYCFVFAIGFCWELGAFHEYYWRNKEIQLQASSSWLHSYEEMTMRQNLLEIHTASKSTLEEREIVQNDLKDADKNANTTNMVIMT